jgi:glycosyltransferase involved in cell wall biosynthesis
MFHANVYGRLLRLILPFGAVISTLHSAAESSRKSEAIRARDWCYRLTDRLAGATVAVSDAVAERHRSARAVRRPIVIPNGIDTDVFRPDAKQRSETRAALGLTSEFVWLAAGRLMWKKGFPAVLDAFEGAGGGLLLIAGTGPDEADLRSRAGPVVRFLGQRNDMPALMNAADAFVLSSVIEGLPLVLLEAAATGLPCVATDVGGVRETGIGIVAAPGGLGSAMRNVATMPPDSRSALGEAGRRCVLARYSLDATVREWDALYRELVRWT